MLISNRQYYYSWLFINCQATPADFYERGYEREVKMIRIGFDPGLEAQQQHASVIRENELLRLAQECIPQSHIGLISAHKILARIGKEMASLGANLEARYGDTPEERLAISRLDSSSSCSS
jgi:hypothetical protein